jgi:hypothetical protein
MAKAKRDIHYRPTGKMLFCCDRPRWSGPVEVPVSPRSTTDVRLVTCPGCRALIRSAVFDPRPVAADQPLSCRERDVRFCDAMAELGEAAMKISRLPRPVSETPSGTLGTNLED